MQGLYSISPSPWIDVQGEPLFQNNAPLDHIQSLHFYINNSAWLIFILRVPMQIWRCEDQIFESEHKNLVIALPYLYWYP